MSRFADLEEDERYDDPAITPTDDDCPHPEAARYNRDDGGTRGPPSFWCAACERLVLNRDGS